MFFICGTAKTYVIENYLWIEIILNYFKTLIKQKPKPFCSYPDYNFLIHDTLV